MAKISNKIKKEPGAVVFYFISAVIVSVLSLLCLLPFILIVTGSISENGRIIVEGYSLLPRGFSLDAYSTIFEHPQKILNAYSVSLTVTALGTLIGVILVAMTGYVLSRPDFKYRNKVAFFLFFTTLFNGGVIPWYIITTQTLHLKNSVWALILPCLMSAFNIFLFRNFLSNIPHDFVESARIDGAGDFRIFWQIMMPLAKPAIATIALFMALMYWNDWFHSSLLITQEEKFALQYVLVRLMSNANAVADMSVVREDSLPSETMKLAMAVITTGPVLLFYPFAQKYFVTGLTIGGVKG